MEPNSPDKKRLHNKYYETHDNHCILDIHINI